MHSGSAFRAAEQALIGFGNSATPGLRASYTSAEGSRTRKQLAQVQETVARFKHLTRKELARTLCTHLDWRTPNGKDKVESCLTLLEALETHGIVSLPVKQTRRAAQRRAPRVEDVPPAPAIETALSAVTPIRLEAVGSSGAAREHFKAYLERYHYLGYRQPVGAHLGYLIVSEPRQEPLGCLLFSASAAWALAPRDQWIGWIVRNMDVSPEAYMDVFTAFLKSAPPIQAPRPTTSPAVSSAYIVWVGLSPPSAPAR